MAVTSAPRKCTEPDVGSCAPTSTPSSVVLPAPFGPTMPTASPERSEKSSPSRTTSALKRLWIAEAARITPGCSVVTASAVISYHLQLSFRVWDQLGAD